MEPQPPMGGHCVPLGGDWELWRDFAVRSAGFPVSGLDVFGPGDEGERLAKVAADPLFREAVTWQNRPALTTQVDSIARAAEQSGSKRRRREAVVANYWQRYCAKNDTIGFFGPLAWGRICDDGPAVNVRSQGLITQREVHFESWCIDALARRVVPGMVVPLVLRPERDVRFQLEHVEDREVRDRGLRALDRLEAAREAVAAARGDDLVTALDAFDATFSDVTGEQAQRPDDPAAAGGRTPLFLDCMRGLEMEIGPAVLRELAGSLPPFLESSRWYCGRSFARGRRIVAEELGSATGAHDLGPTCDRVTSALMTELPRLLRPDLEELQQRWADLLADDDPSSLAGRAAAAFADHGRAWPTSVYHSPDVQIAARSVDDIERGRFLAVIGDFHPANALLQGMFSTRHPDPAALRAAAHADLGSPLLFPILHRRPSFGIDARVVLDFTWPEDYHVATKAGARAPDGYRSIPLEELIVEGDECRDRSSTFCAPLAHLFYAPMFLAAMHTFDPFPIRGDHGGRITIGRTVLRRETWATTSDRVPVDAGDFATWARGREMPRRLFCRPPGEAKPVYVDLESALLARSLHRMLRRLAETDPGASIRFTEMLPGPEECWLEQDGARYTSELRLVAVDRTRRGLARVTVPDSTRAAAAHA